MDIRKLLERLDPWPDRLQGIVGLLIFFILCGLIYGVISLVKVCVDLLAP